MAHSATTTIPMNKLHLHKKGAPFLCEFNQVIVLCFQTQSETDLAIYQSAQGIPSANALTTIAHEAAEHLKAKLSEVVIKCIGPKVKLNTLQAIIEPSTSISVAKWIERDGPFTLFVPENSGRLKLTAAEAAAPPAPTPLTKTVRKTRYPIKVLIVDDSLTIRKLLERVIGSDERFQIIGNLGNPLEVPEFLKTQKPDVITLDIHMPGKNGVELLKEIYPVHHIPAIMISSISKEEGPLVFDALEAGAFDYIQKPSQGNLEDVKSRLFPALEAAATSRPKMNAIVPSQPKLDRNTPITRLTATLDLNRIIAIGSSTGGTEALRQVLLRLPERIPPIVIAQHIPPVFSDALAQRLNNLCPFTVKEAQHGEPVVADTVYIAPGGTHMQLVRRSDNLYIDIGEPAKKYIYSPSVDHLFLSVAQNVGRKAVGIILTGMGGDGSDGLLVMRQKGSHTIGQDEESCVVYGMPREAFNKGAVAEVCSIENVSQAICRAIGMRAAS